MKTTLNFLLLFVLCLAFSCNVENSPTEDHNITATINGETWYFYNVMTNTTEEGDTRMVAQGYLMGDRGAEPANLEIVFVGVPSLAAAGEGYEADFAPSSAGTSAYAVLNMPELNRTFDTKLDPETTGTFTIKEIENNTMSGSFQFKAKDSQGNLINVESAEFKEVQLEQGSTNTAPAQ